MGTGTAKADSVSIVSYDTGIAAVDKSSLTADGSVTVTGVAEGSTTVTLGWSGGSQDGTTSSVAVDVTKKPVDPTKRFNAALAAKPAEQTVLTFRAQNFTKADKAAFAELASLAQKNGVTLTVHFDTVVGNAVAYRMSVNPALV